MLHQEPKYRVTALTLFGFSFEFSPPYILIEIDEI